MNKNFIKKKLLPILTICIGSFILLNLAIIFASIVIDLISQFVDKKGLDYYVHFGVYYFLILLISFVIFKSKISDVLKSTFLVVPLMITLVFLNMALGPFGKLIKLATGGLFILLVLLFISLKKLPWLYYFATFYTIALAAATIIFKIKF